MCSYNKPGASNFLPLWAGTRTDNMLPHAPQRRNAFIDDEAVEHDGNNDEDEEDGNGSTMSGFINDEDSSSNEDTQSTGTSVPEETLPVTRTHPRPALPLPVSSDEDEDEHEHESELSVPTTALDALIGIVKLYSLRIVYVFVACYPGILVFLYRCDTRIQGCLHGSKPRIHS